MVRDGGGDGRAGADSEEALSRDVPVMRTRSWEEIGRGAEEEEEEVEQELWGSLGPGKRWGKKGRGGGGMWKTRTWGGAGRLGRGGGMLKTRTWGGAGTWGEEEYEEVW